jgi:hypothetical protein
MLQFYEQLCEHGIPVNSQDLACQRVAKNFTPAE